MASNKIGIASEIEIEFAAIQLERVTVIAEQYLTKEKFEDFCDHKASIIEYLNEVLGYVQ